MERLNEIMVRQRRQQSLDQRAQPNQQRPPAQPVRRPPLPEQNARLGQPLSRAPQPPAASRPQPTAYNPAPGSGGYGQRQMAGGAREVRDEPASRPPVSPSRSFALRSRPPQQRSDVDSYQARMPQTYVDAPAHAPRRSVPSNEYYQSDDYMAARPATADSLEEDEWDEDEGMRYGDWENDESESAAYLRASAELLSSSEHLQLTRELPALRPQESRAYVSRSPHETLPPPAPEPSRFGQRVTQPLRSNALPETAYERLQEVLQRQARQNTVRERSSIPYAPPSVVPAPAPQPVVAPAPVAALPRGVCPRCRGAGYLRIDVPFGHPNFGKPLPCDCKEADLKERRRQHLRGISNLEAFHDKNFQSFNSRVSGVQRALQAAKAYARDPEGWLMLVGPNGCGKTHLAAAIANARLEQGSLVLFATVPDLLDHLRAAFAPTSTEVYDQLFARMREAELLVLDDLGAQQSSPWASEKLFQLLNYRYNLRFPTVITANPRGLQAVDERIRSRLSDFNLVVDVLMNGAQDYRPSNPRREG